MLENTRLLRRTYYHLSLACVMLLVSFIGNASGQTTQFTYQGKLADSGNPASGQYDFKFKLYDTATVGTGTQQGGDVLVSSVTVTAGIFTVQLDFGACSSCFDGSIRYLEISVKQTIGSTFTTLEPRQQLTSTPYAVRSLNTALADGLSVACVNCVTSTQIGGVNGSAVSGTIPVASVPAGSGNYIQNGTSQQATSNFNISGDGTLGGTLSGNTVNATTQYNIGGSRVLSVPGSQNIFAGVGAGANNTGGSNTFFGFNAGNANISSNLNSFFGVSAGANTTTGCCNTFFGNLVGLNNTTGRSNAFFGGSTGRSNTQGSFNAFYGDGAGTNFFSDTGGSTTGNQNTFIGYLSGLGVTTGSNNTFLGAFTTGVSNLDHATVIGADATVNSNNTIVLGRSADTVQIPGAVAGLLQVKGASPVRILGDTSTLSGTEFVDFFARSSIFSSDLGGMRIQRQASGNIDTLFFAAISGSSASEKMRVSGDGNVGIGISNPAGLLHARGPSPVRILGDTSTLSGSEFVDFFARNSISSLDLGGMRIQRQAETGNIDTLFFAAPSALPASEMMRVSSTGNVGIGTTAPGARLHIAVNSGNILLGDAGCGAGLTGIGFAPLLSGCTDYSLLGDGMDMRINRRLGGTISFRENNIPQMTIFAGGAVSFSGVVGLTTLGSPAGGIALCRSIGLGNQPIVACGASSLRYKDHIKTFAGGLDLVSRLRPIVFTWKSDGSHDLGFAAEEVAQVEPLLIFRNDRGEVEGVRYDRINVVLINAIKQQQAQIEEQQREIQTLKKRHREFDELKRLVCLDHPAAALCKSN